MKSHEVCVITCPNCSAEKVINRLQVRCVVKFTCKVCKAQCRARRNQECFQFDGLFPVNASL